MRRLLFAIALLCAPALAQNFALNGVCSEGGQAVVLQGLLSTGTAPFAGGLAPGTPNGVLASYPGCQVAVYLTGTTNLATLFSDAGGDPLANPFSSSFVDGSWLFFVAAGTYDVTMSGAGMPNPRTLTAVGLGTGGGGGGAFLPLAGGTLTGKVTTAPSAAGGAGFNLPPGFPPSSPVNGDLWSTSAGVFAFINGLVVGPFGNGGTSFFSGLQSGVNTSAAMVVGTGASLTASGTGVITGTGLSNAGNACVLNASGINCTDVFGNTITTTSSLVAMAFSGSTGGSFFAGAYGTIGAGISDNNGNSLFLGNNSSTGSLFNINLSNQTFSSAFVNTTTSTTFVYGNPIQIGVNPSPSGGVCCSNISQGLTISSSGSQFTGYLGVSTNLYVPSTVGGMTGAFSSLPTGSALATQNANNWHAEGPFGGTAVSLSGDMACIFGATGRIHCSSNAGADQIVMFNTDNTSGQSGTALALAVTPTQCAIGSVAAGIAANGNANCVAAGAGTISGITTSGTSGLSGGALSGVVALTLITTCTDQQILVWTASGSSWGCGNAGAGTVTGVTANGGLVATGTTLGLIKTCSNTQVLAWTSGSSSWGCASAGAGTITAVVAGTGLTGGGSSGSVTLNMANVATTVNNQTCTLGSTCTIPFQTNSVNNTSLSGLNLLTSTVNAVGLTVTPTNTGTNQMTFEITGNTYSGKAATATALAAVGTHCSATQATIGIDVSGNSAGCFTPAGTFATMTPGTNTSTTAFAIAPATAVGGSTPTLTLLGAASETNTGAVLFINTGAASVQPSLLVDSKGSQVFLITGAITGNQITAGTCPATPATTGDIATSIFCTGNNSATALRVLSSGVPTTAVVQAETTAVLGTGYKLFSGRVGVGTDGQISAGKEVFSVLGDGTINGTQLVLNGSTSGSAAFQVAAVAGTPNALVLPTATGAANACLLTNGGSPQQLFWSTSCGSGGSTPGGSNFSVQYNSTSTLGGTNVPVLNGLYSLVYNVTANAGVAPVAALSGIIPNPQTGTTYTYLYSDRSGHVTFSNASAIAATLPQANSTGFTANWVTGSCDIGAGTVTITPTTSTISYSTGSAYFASQTSMQLSTGQCATIYSDNTNYFATIYSGGGGGTFATITPGINTSTIPFAVAPTTALGGSTPNFSISAPASDTNTGAALFVNTGASSTQPSLVVQSQGNNALQILDIAGNNQQIVFGACATTPNQSTGSDTGRDVFCSQTPNITQVRQLASSGSFAGTMHQVETILSASGAFRFYDARVGVNADGTVGTGTDMFQVFGSGFMTLGANIGGSGAGIQMFGSSSGSATIQVAAVAGSPNPLVLPTGTGTPGQVLSTNGGSPQQLSWVNNGGGSQVNFPISYQVRVKPIGFSTTAATTVANTASATTLIGSSFSGRQALIAGSMIPFGSGYKTLHIHSVGVLGTAVSAPTLSITVILGGVTVGTIAAPVIGSLSSDGWDLDFYITITGMTTANAGGCMRLIGTASAGLLGCTSSAAVTGLNFATSQLVDVQAQWSTPSASNTITANMIDVYPTPNGN